MKCFELHKEKVSSSYDAQSDGNSSDQTSKSCFGRNKEKVSSSYDVSSDENYRDQTPKSSNLNDILNKRKLLD